MSDALSRSIRSRCVPACRAISTACISRMARPSSRATSCSPSTSGHSRTRSIRRAPIWCRPSQTRLIRSPISRAASNWCATRPSPTRLSSSARRPIATPRLGSATMRPRFGRPNSTWSSPNCARRSTAASATGGCRQAIWSPAARPATPHCSPPSCRPTRSGSNSPSMRRPICATSDCRKAATTSPAAAPARKSRSS